MSAAYTLHVASYAAPGDPRALERAHLVRDGFSWGAFLVPALYFIRHRHWLLGLGAAAAVAGLAVVLRIAGARGGTIISAELLLHGLIGFEAASLRRWALARRDRPVMDVVYAANEAEAEAKSFARWLADRDLREAPRAPVRSARTAWAGRRDEPVIGLFPDLEGRP